MVCKCDGLSSLIADQWPLSNIKGNEKQDVCRKTFTAPIDPHQLLKALAPLLSRAGAIKSAVEAKRITSLMRDANKLVCRCVYVNILKATDSQEVMEMLMEGGMWEILNGWLQDATDSENTPFLVELLKVYRHLPVSVEIMKQNNAAKTIKQISKSKDENLKSLAAAIVDTWMRKIREKSNTESSNNNGDAKKMKKKHHSRGEKSDGSKSEHKHKSHSDSKDRKSHSNHHSRSSTDSDISEAKVESSNNKGSNSIKSDKSDDGRKRARTVKVQPQRFRSTGLEEPSLPPPKRKTSDISNKRASLEKPDRSSEPPEKKTRPLVNTTLATSLTANTTTTTTPSSTSPSTASAPALSPTEIHEKIKIIPPKPMTSAQHKVMDSSGFMNALTSGPTAVPLRRKKKLPSVTMNNKTGPSTTMPTTPTTPTPLSPNSAMVQKLPSVPSFYKDTLETPEVSKENEDKPKSRSPSPTEEKNGSTDSNLYEDTTKEKEEGTDVASKSENGEVTETSSTPSGAPIIRKKKKKKSVTWADDSRIRQIFYFELDETERENVNKPKDFNAMKKQEMMMDRRTIETAKRLSHDNMAETIAWRRPPHIHGLPAIPEVTSAEKEIQTQREQGVLQALFFSKDMLPDSPSEPEMETIERIDPTLIPLDDENSGGEEYHYTYDEAPPARESSTDLTTLLAQTSGMPVPPDVANLLTSMQRGIPPGPAGFHDNPQLMATVQNFIASVMNQDNPDESTEQLKKILEPLQHQFGMTPPPMVMEGLPPMGAPRMGRPPMVPPPHGLLGMAPPGFGHMGPGIRGPPPPGGPRPRFPGPPQGPPGPNVRRQTPGREDEWGENMRGGPPMGPMRPRGRAGFPVMRGRGPPPPGRGGSRGGRGRGSYYGEREVCRHFARGGCQRGDSCAFLHPGVNGPL